MTQQEIQERNKQIALMLGWKYSFAHKVDQYGYYQTVDGYSTPYINTLDEQAVEYQSDKNAFAIEDLQFHSDWNWLMEAVEFIEKLRFNTKACVHCNNDRVYLKTYPLTQTELSPEEEYFAKFISVTNFHFEFCYALKPTKKEAVFIAVSDFAKLYNERKL